MDYKVLNLIEEELLSVSVGDNKRWYDGNCSDLLSVAVLGVLRDNEIEEVDLPIVISAMNAAMHQALARAVRVVYGSYPVNRITSGGDVNG